MLLLDQEENYNGLLVNAQQEFGGVRTLVDNYQARHMETMRDATIDQEKSLKKDVDNLDKKMDDTKSLTKQQISDVEAQNSQTLATLESQYRDYIKDQNKDGDQVYAEFAAVLTLLGGDVTKWDKIFNLFLQKSEEQMDST